MPPQSELVVGIDLGTTNSACAIVREGRASVVRRGEDRIVPSVVAALPDGSIVVGNRAKRFFAESVLLRGSRVGLGPAVIGLPPQSERFEFERSGARLAEPHGGDEQFLVQTYARDTGAIVTVLAVPIYVKGHRWGAAILGWNEDDAR